MSELIQTLASYQIVKEIIAADKPGVLRILNDAATPEDAYPHFWGQRDNGQRVPGTWLVSLEDRLKGSKAGMMFEGLWESWSTRFPSVKGTVPWICAIEKTHRHATRDEVLAHLKAQEQKRQEMAETELRLRKTRAIAVKPADAGAFSSGESIEQLKERLKVLREIKKLEGGE